MTTIRKNIANGIEQALSNIIPFDEFFADLSEEK